jgi:hypothetical protein
MTKTLITAMAAASGLSREVRVENEKRITMSTQLCVRPLMRSCTLAAAAVAGAVVMSPLGVPSASAAPQDDIWNGINAKHVSAGCPGYGGADALANVAVQKAKTMAFNDGRPGAPGTFAPTTEQLLGNQGYFPNPFGEMDYFKNDGSGSAQDAVNFWSNSGTAGLFPNCDMKQMAVGVWINGKNFAAVSLMGTPGPAPEQGPAPKVG